MKNGGNVIYFYLLSIYLIDLSYWLVVLEKFILDNLKKDINVANKEIGKKKKTDK